MTGTRLAHYLVLERLGAGGMGEVYVAEDERLGRKVALKIPRPGVADAPDRRDRFLREARATAALNHPNIVHLYSVEESDGLLFLTMELVQGRSLRDRLRGGAPLPIETTMAVAIRIAEGLACAHAAGILHRDLTPGNVMIDDEGRVKILDFGLAKLFGASSTFDGEAATMAAGSSSPGMTLGTAGYMSPEQALGQPIDERTDLFALGAVLFEMATGTPPFPGEALAAVFDRLLHHRPPSAQSLNADVPDALAAIIAKALEKNPEQRYRSASAMLDDLRGAARSDAGPAIAAPATIEAATAASIVVLPFVDMSPGQDQAYFCHGMTEEIISCLTRVPGLRVISRTSAFAFAGQGLQITEIGRRLRVRTALEGSVRKAGNRVRITAQLVDTADGHQLWSQRFDRDLADVFAIQDEIAETIADALRNGRGSPARRSSLDAAAHDAHLRGLYALSHWTERSVERAIADFSEAIARDPGFAPAYASLAEAHIWLYSGVGLRPASAAVPHARWAVERALELDPALADAHRARASIAMNHDWDRRAAEEGLVRALELGPGSAASRVANGWRLALLERRHDRALAELEEAERLDPLALQIKTLIGYVHHFRHDVDRAVAQFERVVAMQPAFAFAHYALGDAWTASGRFDRAIDRYEKAIELDGRSANHVAALAHAHGRAGRRDEAAALLGELTARAAQGYVAPIWIALAHLGTGDVDRTFEWLDRACEERDGSLVLAGVAVEFDPVRSHPRFVALLGRMGLGHLARRAS